MTLELFPSTLEVEMPSLSDLLSDTPWRIVCVQSRLTFSLICEIPLCSELGSLPATVEPH